MSPKMHEQLETGGRENRRGSRRKTQVIDFDPAAIDAPGGEGGGPRTEQEETWFPGRIQSMARGCEGSVPEGRSSISRDRAERMFVFKDMLAIFQGKESGGIGHRK
jgi:hypothetical protein